ncbi:MAG TPA: glycosyl hydrolase family 3 [Treponema sp.]|nr:glycosyl hydrolase family 3 [Treponema sp.]
MTLVFFSSTAQTINVLAEQKEKTQSLPDDIDFWSDYPHDILAQTIVDRMTDEELLSQILMFGWAGAEPSALLNAWVSDRGLGSVKVFGWNTDDIHQVARSVNSLQQRAAARRFKIPLFVATDQEGGWIRHVKGDTTDTPGNMAIGASGYPIDAYYSGYYINREIKALGINMNFAPTVDIYTNLDSSVIGPRSFGSDPQKVGILGEAFAKGSMDAGVIPTAKHFPGHGDTDVDSHGRLPYIDIDFETLMNRELVPFKYLIASGIPAIMSGHLEFPQIQEKGIPSSLSKKFLTDILRGQLGYEGLIITDDMMMNGATLYTGTLYGAVQMAIEAGNDIILSSTTAGLNEALWTRNLALMKSEGSFHERVKDAAYRVIKAKLEYFKSGNAAPLYPDANTIDQFIPDKQGQQFFFEEACRAVTVYKAGDFPYHPKEGERILIAGPFLSLYSEGRKRYPQARTFHFSYELAADQSNYDEWNASSLVSVAAGYDTIIINVFNEHTANIARRLRYMGKKVIILSIMSPVPVLDFDWADTILCGYSYSDFSFQALFAALNGEIECEGTIPLDQI